MAVTYLFGIDPGEHIGFTACTLEDGKLTINFAEEWNQERLYLWLKESLNPEYDATVICEDYIIDPRPKSRGGTGYAHQWDKGATLRQIGAIHFLCQMNEWKLELQPNFRKPAGYGFLGMKYVQGKKGAHVTDSLAHLAYYIVDRKLWVPSIPEKAPAPSVRLEDNHPKFRVQHQKLWRSARKP